LAWNPEQYLKFSQPRLRPALDLLARVEVERPQHVVDLGCGTGNVTRLLQQRWPDARLTGVDDSAEMLAQAAAQFSTIRWEQQSISQWKPAQPVDVIFSNAALHWLPDHERLIPALMNHVAPGGVLAIQMPRNFSAPSHTLIAETADAGSWKLKLEPLLGPPPVAPPERYYAWLAPACAEIDIWETEYLHILQGADPVKEWVKGTWLKQFLDRLDPSEQPAFEADYAKRLRAAYPPQADGSTVFPFRRLFLVLRAR
jgi:trans-aconitate 2-methyltransferase